MTRNVLMLWYQEGDNFGDVLIANTTREYLKEHGINSIDYEVGRPCCEVIEEANKCDFLLFAGGGIIEKYIPNVIRHFKADYHMLKVRYGVIGFGMADYDYSDYHEQIEFWVRHADFFYVRDSYTKSQLDSIVGMDKVIYSADDVFANKHLANYCSFIQTTTSVIGINIRNMPYRDITGEIDSESIKEVCDKCHVSLWIPDSYQNKIECIFQNSESNSAISTDNCNIDEKSKLIIDAICRCNYVIAMRYHVILVAARLGKIPLPIIYSPKVRTLSEQLGINELAVEYNAIHDIPSKMKIAKENSEFYLRRIKNNVERLEDRAVGMYKQITDYLEGAI
ncbi:MAG: polysaccharide pyruvyl transferase family protein [Butyrivibrio sp.]|nr:polysaccharide pyruvyl transferase family protein [Butyrivibrio sp.]